MPIATRTFRVFVSSTFEDLKEERNALQREVFPKLRTLCEQYGARFQAIDLRWGVRDEAALGQQTMEICLHEIRRCQATGVRPNFIVLLGDRYGWQPLPPRIPANEFDAMAVNTPWYRLDENAVPPEYCLQSRPAELDWEPIEQEIRVVLAKAARAAGLDPFKYEASATHQEILAGLGQTEQDRQHVFAFVRPLTAETDPRIEELRSDLRVYEFSPDAVYNQLRQVIEAEIASFAALPALDLEIKAHDHFAEDRCRIFVGRDTVLKAIADYISGPDRRPLVLHGGSGSGKSAVIARASQRYKGPVRMIRRFIGASPESANGHALLTSLCRQMASDSTTGDVPVDYAQLENAFRERLSVSTTEQPLILFIDALDQLAASDPARETTWLPPELPPHVKVIVSTTDEVWTAFSPFGGPEGPILVQLEPMSLQEAAQALDDLLHDAHRKLQPWQREKILSHFNRCGLPLFLKLAAEESRLWKSYTPEAACELGEGVAGVIDTLFDRLASNANHGPTLVERSLAYLAAARYGLTEDEVLDVLAADDAVWNDFYERKHHEVSERRLPVVVWSRLSLDLEPYLTERAAPGGTVIAFYHRQLQERVVGRFEVQARHHELALYFAGRPVADTRRLVELSFQQRTAQKWTEAEGTLFDSQFLLAKVSANLVLDLDADYRALLQEAPEISLPRREALQLIHGALRLSMHAVAKDPVQFSSQLVGRLLDYRDKCVAKFVAEIAAAAPHQWMRLLYPTLHPPGTALLRTLEGHSGRVFGVAVTPDCRRAVSASDDKTLMVWDLETGRALHTLEGHSGNVNGVAVTPGGKRAISASDDHTLKVWDLETGRALRTLEGHSGNVNGVAVTPDGKRAISASDDHTLKVWDLETGRVLRTLEGHSHLVHGVAVSPDGKRAVSASWDKTLKVWDLETGRPLGTLEGHTAYVHCVAVTADGKRAITASWDKTLKVWDLENGCALQTLEGHSAAVDGVAVTPDGMRAVSASTDRTLKVWDLESGHPPRTLEGHSWLVTNVAVTADGKRAVSASWDNTLKVWGLETGHALRTVEGHSSFVQDVTVTADGKQAVSASADHTLKVWDLDTGRPLRTLEGHSDCVDGVAVTADGKRAVSASWDNTLKVWDLETGRALRALEGHSDDVWGVALTPDGKRAVSASKDTTLKVWDLETGRVLHTLEDHSFYVYGVAVTADGKRAVSASADQTLKVWDLDTGRALLTLKGHSDCVFGVAVTADGKQAVSASRDMTLKVWDLETGRMLRTLEGHSALVHDVAVTADGKRAISVSDDKTLKMWDLSKDVIVATFHFDASPRCCAFADRRRIVAGDDGGRVYCLALEE